MMNHPICHVEIPAKDPAQAGEFYSELFGWELESHPEMDYVMYRYAEQAGGGFPRADDGIYKPGGALVYVFTDDIDASLAKAESLGAQTVMTKSEIPGVGWYGIFTDPSGNNIALFTNA
jgi:predicted enzyme related to lactoylglutathione lyase